MLLYLEGIPQKEIGEITGLRPNNVATKVCRIKKVCRAALEEDR
jgi:DNA-directed RNA polymerase specialized sigma24 family protein